MRSSQTLIPTLKETPSDAEVISHQLMLRAGFIRKLAAGLYTWLPMGLKVLRKVENIVREEMDRAGAQEVLMPSIQPAELWQESGRWEQYGPELLRVRDRHQREFCYGPTHEEIITDLIRNDIHSYKQLPANFYQIQTKFRDEVRPRFGLMRGREFLMKDAYSFHTDQASLEQTYQTMHATYCRIFDRLGLDYRPVEADTGSIGGSASHEFHVLAESGEDDIAFSTESDYAANVEMAEAVVPARSREAASQNMSEVATPGQHSIEEVCAALGVNANQTVKTLLVKGAEENSIVALLIRGDHTLNEIKAEKHPLVFAPLTMATDAEIKQTAGCNAGSIGPVGLKATIIADRSVNAMHDFICGANKDGYHLTGVNWQRDLPETTVADLRNVQNGDPSPDGKGTLKIRRGIEVGHIFQLGKKYSEALNASVLDENGKSIIMTMGCYGIGVSRIVAAAIEQNNDDKGIIWPDSIAPVQVAIVPINAHKSDAVKKVAEDLYADLQAKGIEVLLDDRKERPGVMFADIELMGIPHRVTIGDKTLANNEVEYINRRSMEKEALSVDNLAESVAAKIKLS